jgi:uncharacterized protein with ParB-like and HNH nuclease domain
MKGKICMATFTSDKQTLTEVLKNVEQAKLQLPDFQRGWVWDDERNELSNGY